MFSLTSKQHDLIQAALCKPRKNDAREEEASLLSHSVFWTHIGIAFILSLGNLISTILMLVLLINYFLMAYAVGIMYLIQKPPKNNNNDNTLENTIYQDNHSNNQCAIIFAVTGLWPLVLASTPSSFILLPILPNLLTLTVFIFMATDIAQGIGNKQEGIIALAITLALTITSNIVIAKYFSLITVVTIPCIILYILVTAANIKDNIRLNTNNSNVADTEETIISPIHQNIQSYVCPSIFEFYPQDKIHTQTNPMQQNIEATPSAPPVQNILEHEANTTVTPIAVLVPN